MHFLSYDEWKKDVVIHDAPKEWLRTLDLLVCVRAGAARSGSVYAVSYWYATRSRATGLPFSTEPLGSRLLQ